MAEWISAEKFKPTQEWLRLHGWHDQAVITWDSESPEPSGWAMMPEGIVEFGTFTHWMPLEPPSPQPSPLALAVQGLTDATVAFGKACRKAVETANRLLEENRYNV